MRISDWSSDVCSSDLKAFADRRALGGQVDHAGHHHDAAVAHEGHPALLHEAGALGREKAAEQESVHIGAPERRGDLGTGKAVAEAVLCAVIDEEYRSEEHTSELQSLMRISSAVFCLKKKNQKTNPATS